MNFFIRYFFFKRKLRFLSDQSETSHEGEKAGNKQHSPLTGLQN